MVIGVGLPKTGTTTLAAALRQLGVAHKVGDQVHMMEGWPEAKLILTVRETPDVWYDSVERWAKKKPKMTSQRTWMYGRPVPERELWIRQYITHNRALSKLPNCITLCWEKGDGWNELCEFLGVDVPDKPFPHLNKNK